VSRPGGSKAHCSRHVRVIAVSVLQACHPPVLAMLNCASTGPVADPVRNSTLPPPTAEATRACTVSGPAAPRLTLSYRSQSPSAR
jgi:hypothetical protein